MTKKITSIVLAWRCVGCTARAIIRKFECLIKLEKYNIKNTKVFIVKTDKTYLLLKLPSKFKI